jgi:phospholipid/cholesterol/gamma-HCH transport system ATP-binding protein
VLDPAQKTEAFAWNIELRDVTVGYTPDRPVLSRLNAALPGGRITMILGESGCGKSTLLRHLLGLMRPFSGTISVGGHDIFTLAPKSLRRLRRRMGALFQDGALLGSFTLFENVALPLREHTRLPEATIREIVEHQLSLVGLRGVGDLYPNQLSGGMRKRAGLARALVMNPPILFCDEPTSGLDPINAAQMDQLLADTSRFFKGMTTVVVSHDLHSLHRIAEHVILLHDGGIAFSGDKEAFLASKNEYAMRFLNAKPSAAARPPIELASEVQAELNIWLSE